MASDTNNHGDESTPLLDDQHSVCEEKDPSPPLSLHSLPPPCTPSVPLQPETHQETAQEVPLGAVSRTPWETGLTDCLGHHDQFCSTDLEVCILGCLTPCVLHGSNVERLGSGYFGHQDFTSHCTAYLGLCLIGDLIAGWGILVPYLSYHNRSNLRRRFNLEGNCESLVRAFGCCESLVEEEVQREKWETDCDLITHIVCHQCALCQEGRELRRRIPHPALSNNTAFAVSPPREQTMARDLP